LETPKKSKNQNDPKNQSQKEHQNSQKVEDQTASKTIRLNFFVCVVKYQQKWLQFEAL